MGLQFCFCYPCNQWEVQLSGWKWDQEISCSPRVSLAWVISGVALSTLTAGLDSLSHTFCVSMNYTNFEDLLRTSRHPLNSMPVGNMWDQNRNTTVHLVFLSRKKKKKQNLGKKSFEIGVNCIWTYKWFRKHARQDYGHQLKVLSYVSFCDLICHFNWKWLIYAMCLKPGSAGKLYVLEVLLRFYSLNSNTFEHSFPRFSAFVYSISSRSHHIICA